MKLEEKKLAKGLEVKRLVEVCTYSKGKMPKVLTEEKSDKCPVPYINIKAFERGVFSEYTNGEKCNLCDDDDLLMVWDGARCGLIGKAKKGAVGSTLMKILPKEIIHKEFLYYFISSKFRILNTKPRGVGIPHIEPSLLWNFELFLPPLAEQQAIVAKIEELFTQLESGKQELLNAQAKLKTYRQSLLKYAFEGRLTNKNLKKGELPKNWKKTTLGKIISITSGTGLTKSNRNDAGEYFVYGGNGVTGKHSDFLFKEEKLIIGRVGVHCGNPYITQPKSWVTDNAFVVSFNEKETNISFLLHLIKFLNLNKYSVSTAQPVISQSKIYPIDIFCPEIEEQKLIVSLLESKLTICDKIEETINASLKQAETLRQSILKKAFEGKLIKPQQETAIYKPHNEYFYQMQLMGWVLAISKQKKIEHGEMTSAKYIYLIDRIYGIPTFYEFKRGHLGPFPAALKKTINNKQYFKKTSGHLEVVNGNTLFKSVNPYTEKTQKAVGELADFFSKYTAKDRAHKTELLATICKVIEDIQTTKLESVRKSMEEWPIELKNSPNSTKAAKFSEEETAKCLQFLIEKGWDQKILHKK